MVNIANRPRLGSMVESRWPRNRLWGLHLSHSIQFTHPKATTIVIKIGTVIRSRLFLAVAPDRSLVPLRRTVVRAVVVAIRWSHTVVGVRGVPSTILGPPRHSSQCSIRLRVRGGRVRPGWSGQGMGSRRPDGALVIGEAHLRRLASTSRASAKAQPHTLSAVASRSCGGRIFNYVHSCPGGLFELLSPVLLVPPSTSILKNEVGNVQILQVAVTLVLGHGEHERSGV